MRNKIIESAIDRVVDESEHSLDFKNAFKQYIKNKFDGNATESDLKMAIKYIELSKEDNEL